MSDVRNEEEERLERQTDEGAQELRSPRRTREVVIAGEGMWPEDDLGETMIINMGPQHPSTHGVLRLMMELDGEDVLRIKPVVGYLHTGMEKTGEELTYVQGTTNVTRMDYASNFANELVYSLAVERLLDIEVPDLEAGVRDYDDLLSENPIWRERTVGVGIITTEECLRLSITGPILRSTGFAWDLRKAQPNLPYDEVDFDVVYTANGDVFDRYRIRLWEILESAKIVRQCVGRMPPGDFRIQDKKVTPPPRARIDESMEALIHHFKLFTEGFKVPSGETYVAVESPRGEIGCYMVSDGSGKPVRCHIRGPSFYNLQAIQPMGGESLVADAVAIVSSIDPIMGEVDR